MKRKKMSPKASKRVFHKTAGTHSKNLRARPMRGGYRL
ncbi:MAG: hypothetical protein [Microvirus sp.]|nr:MAG: hypothetical protein [Microvirus sp.]